MSLAEPSSGLQVVDPRQVYTVDYVGSGGIAKAAVPLGSSSEDEVDRGNQPVVDLELVARLEWGKRTHSEL